jgi:hypothetical protein
MFEAAGAAGILLEDQVMPKRCGHFANKQVVPTEEMVARIRAAVERGEIRHSSSLRALTPGRLHGSGWMPLTGSTLLPGGCVEVAFIERTPIAS